MKKHLLTALALLLALTALQAASCGSPAAQPEDVSAGTAETTAADTSEASTDTSGATAVTEAPVTTEAVKSSAYECKLDNGVTVTVGSKADGTLAALNTALGKELDYMEAPSCVHPGTDKVYTFDGFTVSTSPAADGTEYVTELSLLSDAVALNGIMIGSTADEVTAALGSDFTEKFGVRKYADGDITISVTFTDGAVTAFSISKAI